MKIELRDSGEDVAGGRRSTRIEEKSKQVTLWLDSERSQQGKLFDESFGGIGIQFNTKVPLERGQEIEVSYNGVQMWALVRHVATDDTGDRRVGLEWKAAGLAERVRQAILANDSGRSKDRSEQELARFRELLPSGFYMMWTFFEHENWYELGETAERLKQTALACEIGTLTEHVKQLQNAVKLPEPKETSKKALCRLMEECIHVLGADVKNQFTDILQTIGT